jgi:hypothetical protein
MMGEAAELLLPSFRQVPAKAHALGFTFRYPRLEEALSARSRPDGGRPRARVQRYLMATKPRTPRIRSAHASRSKYRSIRVLTVAPNR